MPRGMKYMPAFKLTVTCISVFNARREIQDSIDSSLTVNINKYKNVSRQQNGKLFFLIKDLLQ